jgi:hypothetical protein
MFNKVSVLVPTRGRIERLQTFFASYEATIAGHEDLSEVVFRVDDDDHSTIDFLRASGKPYIRETLIAPRLQGYKSMPTFFNEMARAANGNVLMCGNDDMVFRTPGWARTILDAANEYPDGLFDFGVSTYNEDHYPFSIVSRYVVQRLGFLWDPRIYWGDIFLRDVMGAFDRCRMLPSVQIDHDWAGNTPDKTFHEADQTSIYQSNPSYWATTHAEAVADAVARLKNAVGHTISFIVPTSGREQLYRTIDSIETWPGDEILLVGAPELRLSERDFVRARPEIRVIDCAPGYDWGSTERNYVTPMARGSYLSFMDDDDEYVPGTRAVLETAMNGNPSIFRMRYQNGGVLWGEPEIRCGNVGTPMVFVPNVLDRIGQWGPNVGGDCDYMFRLKWAPEEFTWREEVIALIRP